MDKEVNEGSDSRDDKRYTEKKNKTERARRKKEDIARLRTLVDLTLSLDPRIKRIKQEEKEAREKAKQKGKGGKPGEDAKKKAEEDAKKAEEDAKKAAEAEEVSDDLLSYESTFLIRDPRTRPRRRMRKRPRPLLPTPRRRLVELPAR